MKMIIVYFNDKSKENSTIVSLFYKIYRPHFLSGHRRDIPREMLRGHHESLQTKHRRRAISNFSRELPIF